MSKQSAKTLQLFVFKQEIKVNFRLFENLSNISGFQNVVIEAYVKDFL